MSLENFRNVKLDLIIGPMFSGKSTEIIRRIRLLKSINKSLIVVKPIIDNRYNDDKITSHNFEVCDCISVNKLSDIYSGYDLKTVDTIVIDEGQFFEDLVDCVVDFVENKKINVIVSGLDGDYKRNPIGKILYLIPYSTSCLKLTSLCKICKNGEIAPFTKRTIKSDETILIGGTESYIPVCRNHYFS